MNATHGTYDSAVRAVLEGAASADFGRLGMFMWEAVGRDGMTHRRAEKALAEAFGDVEFEWPWLDRCLAAGKDGAWLKDALPDVSELAEERGAKIMRKARRELLIRAVLLHVYAAMRYVLLREGGYKLWIYKADGCPVPSHAKLDKLTLDPSHWFWGKYTPPSFIGCRCRIIGADGPASIARLGGSLRKKPPQQ